MRTSLAKKNNQKINVKATIGGFSKTHSGKSAKDTICLINVFDIDENKIITDHAWIYKSKKFNKLNLDRGDIIEFKANIREYKKSNGCIDFRFSWPSNIKRKGIDYSKQRLINLNDPIWQVDRQIEFLRKKSYSSNLSIDETDEICDQIKNLQKEKQLLLKNYKKVTCPHCRFKFNILYESHKPIKCNNCKGTFIA